LQDVECGQVVGAVLRCEGWRWLKANLKVAKMWCFGRQRVTKQAQFFLQRVVELGEHDTIAIQSDKVF
jgi:hypothetical protein